VREHEATEIELLTERPRPFAALYEHWERHQWSPFEIDFSTDAKTFASLDAATQEGLMWIFAHRFHAEWNVAALLAPFLLAAPDYDVQLLLATQVADEHRHIESVVRVYTEVFGVEGGVGAVKALADAQLDPVAAALYDTLDGVVRQLEHDRSEDRFLQAVVAYHLLAEGSIGRANQNFVAAKFAAFGAFPGLTHVQRLAVRDEVRHIGIGVSHARRRIDRDGDDARAVVREIVDGFRAIGEGLVDGAASEIAGDFVAAYGADPATMWGEVTRQLDLRLRSIRYSPVAV
jgi:ribonucleotide reductase beta subunit family protein with ferritin-like domain